MLTAPGMWEGGGFSNPRLDRLELLRRVGEMPTSVVDFLADTFESVVNQVTTEKAEKKARKKPRRRGRATETED